MYIRESLTISAMLVSLSACADPRPGDARSLPVTTSAHEFESGANVGMDLKCGAATFVLVGGDENARVKSQHMKPATLLAPRGMQGFVPVGLGCAASASGKQYLVVQYGETPFGCKVCEWFFIYDEHGAPMNDAVPPTRGYGETLEANNDGYQRILSELGLRHPSIEYSQSAPM